MHRQLSQSFSVITATTKEQWQQALSRWPDANFRQSWQWSEFERSMGKTTFPLLIIEGESAQSAPVGLCLAVKEPARRGAYLAVAAGPLIDWSSTHIVAALWQHLRSLAVAEHCLFIRFRPQVVVEDFPHAILAQIKAIHAPMHLTADLTLQLDLTLDDDVLLSQMRKNTRSAIRKSDRVGITTRVSTDVTEIQNFYEVQLAVAQRHGFVPFGKKFLEHQFREFVADDSVVLVHAEKDGVLLATAFVIFFNGEAVYHYGVSTPENAKQPGAYAAQWRSIQEAKKRGCTRYNFWGIAPKEHRNHRFSGVSLFKRGFGGTEIQYVPAYDVPVSPLYWVTFAFEWIRKKTRKL